MGQMPADRCYFCEHHCKTYSELIMHQNTTHSTMIVCNTCKLGLTDGLAGLHKEVGCNKVEELKTRWVKQVDDSFRETRK